MSLSKTETLLYQSEHWQGMSKALVEEEEGDSDGNDSSVVMVTTSKTVGEEKEGGECWEKNYLM